MNDLPRAAAPVIVDNAPAAVLRSFAALVLPLSASAADANHVMPLPAAALNHFKS